MVTIAYIEARARANRDHIVGRAFCIALGIDPFVCEPRERFEDKEYEGVAWCFRNFGSPMDRM